MQVRPVSSGISTTAVSEFSAEPSVSPPPAWSESSISEWWQRLATVPHAVLMLDYDGTLAPFVRERMQAKLYPGVAERLLRLAHTPRVRLVLVSGRPARELLSLLPNDLHPEIWGSHGREHLTPDGGYRAITLKPLQQQCIAQLETTLHAMGLAGVVEKKVGSLAMHTRGLDEAEANRIVTLARDFSCGTSEDSGLEWLPFDGGIELRGTGCSKATAVETIVREERPGTPAAYLGDDQTDEDAFTALAENAGHAPALRVLVRPQPRSSKADLWLTPPHELLAFLDRWLAVTASPRDLR